jgi:hypothetical protein
MLSSISSYISSRQELIAEQQLLYAERMRAEGVSEAVRIALIESLQEDLDEVARTQSAELARGVSHRVWENAEETRPPTVKWGQVFLAAFIRNPYPIPPRIDLFFAVRLRRPPIIGEAPQVDIYSFAGRNTPRLPGASS